MRHTHKEIKPIIGIVQMGYVLIQQIKSLNRAYGDLFFYFGLKPGKNLLYWIFGVNPFLAILKTMLLVASAYSYERLCAHEWTLHQV